MAVLGSLNVLFRADTKKFSSGMSQIGNSIQSVKRLAIGAGAALGAYMSVKMLKDSAGAIDAQAKFADRLGASYEMLQNLTMAAGEAGVGSESFNNSIQKMARSLGDSFVNGSGTAAKALGSLGISIEDLKGMSADQQFLKIGQALGNVDDQSEKLSLAFSLFGKQGAALIPMFDGMKGGTDGVSTVMDKLGVTISRVDAKSIEDANDAMGKLEILGAGVSNIFVAKLAPYIKIVSDKLLELVKGVDIANMIGKAFSYASKGVAVLGNSLNILIEIANVVKGAFEGVAAGITGAIGWLGEKVSKTLGDTESETYFFFKVMQDEAAKQGKTAANNLKNAFKGVGQEIYKFIDPKTEQMGDKFINKVKAAINNQKAAATAAVAQTNKAVAAIDTGSMKALKDRQKSLQTFVNSMQQSMKTPIDTLKENFLKLAEAFKNGLIDEGQFKSMTEKIKKDFADVFDKDEEKAGKEAKSPTFAKIFDGKNVNISAFQSTQATESINVQKKSMHYLKQIDGHLAKQLVAVAVP